MYYSRVSIKLGAFVCRLNQRDSAKCLIFLQNKPQTLAHVLFSCLNQVGCFLCRLNRRDSAKCLIFLQDEIQTLAVVPFSCLNQVGCFCMQTKSTRFCKMFNLFASRIKQTSILVPFSNLNQVGCFLCRLNRRDSAKY